MKTNAAHAVKTRAFPLEIKALDDKTPGTFTGYASVFNVRDSYNEVVVPGAFADSLAKHKREGTFPLMLWQHDPWEVIGKWDDLSDDGKGLYGEGRLLLDLQRAKEAHILLREEAIQGLSIGYREVDIEPAKDGEPRKLIKLDLLEVSIVSFAANRRARVEEVKMSEQMTDFAKRLRDGDPPPIKEFEDILREAGVPRALAKQIASVGYAKAIRCEAEGDEANNQALASALADLQSAVASFPR